MEVYEIKGICTGKDGVKTEGKMNILAENISLAERVFKEHCLEEKPFSSRGWNATVEIIGCKEMSNFDLKNSYALVGVMSALGPTSFINLTGSWDEVIKKFMNNDEVSKFRHIYIETLNGNSGATIYYLKEVNHTNYGGIRCMSEQEQNDFGYWGD